MASCALCQRDRPLRQSHIIPKFVVRWLKDTGATQYLRQAIHPNIRRQDFGTQPLLCDDCEQRFAAWENRFAERVFFPFQQERRQSFDYGEWLLSFATSLAWRTVIGFHRAPYHMFPERTKLAPALERRLEQAQERWRVFLLGESHDPGPYEHHLFFWDVAAQVEGGVLPRGFHMYILRAADGTVAHSSRAAFVYSKLPGMMFWAGVEPPLVEGWERTLIARQGTISSPQRISQSGFGDFLLDRVQIVGKLMSAMSDRQREKIDRAYRENPERVLESDTLRAHLASLVWEETQGKRDVKGGPRRPPTGGRGRSPEAPGDVPRPEPS